MFRDPAVTDGQESSRRTRSRGRGQRTGWLPDALILSGLTAVAIGLVLVSSGPIPTGADPGNWIAVASTYWGGDVMSAEVWYLPFFPGALSGLIQLTNSLLAFQSLGALVIALFLVSVYISARPLGRGYAVVAALVVGLAGGQTEAYAWGGYPQILATGFGFVGVYMLLRNHETRDRRYLVSAVVAIALTLATHAMVGGLIGFVIAVSAAHWVYMAEPRFGRVRVWVTAGAIASVSTVIAGLTLVLGPEGADATLNPAGETRWEAVVRVFRDAPLPWALLALGALVVVFIRHWPRKISATVATGSSWCLAGLLFFMFTGEPRALLIVQVGVVLLGVLAFASLYDYLRGQTEARHARPSSKGKSRALLIGGASMLAALLVGGFGAYLTAKDWYRLVDEPEVAALDDLRGESSLGDLAFASIGLHGMPVGWWVEGYAQTSAYSAHDPAFLAFPDEIEQAEIANEFFSGELTVDESLAVLDETGAEFVVVDRRGPDAGWLESEVADEFTIVDDDSNLVVLRRSS